MSELRRYDQKLIDAPDPPSASASCVVASPSTRWYAPRVKSTGSSDPGSLPSETVVESEVRSIQ